jgi:hypothetical protein
MPVVKSLTVRHPHCLLEQRHALHKNVKFRMEQKYLEKTILSCRYIWLYTHPLAS